MIQGKDIWQKKPLNSLNDGYVYIPGKPLSWSDTALESSEGQLLVDACEAPKWLKPHSGKLLAGGLAIFRACGALNWRPHIWITGAAGSGKTTLLDRVINPIGGDWAIRFNGATTEAGLRQTINHSSLPIIYDEAETNDEKTSRRIRAIIEYARQSSYRSDAVVVKGSPSGKAITYSCNSSFILSSIRVNLSDEADVTRFTVLELNRPDRDKWKEIENKFDAITHEYGNALLRRIADNFDELDKAIYIFGEAIRSFDTARTSQQYGALLGGYWMLLNDRAPSYSQALDLGRGIVSEFFASERGGDGLEHEGDEWECLNWLLSIRDRDSSGYSGGGDRTVRELITLAAGEIDSGTPAGCCRALANIGILISEDMFHIASSSPDLTRGFTNTKWTGQWNNTLHRIPGAERSMVRFSGIMRRTVRIPLSIILKK